MAADLNDLSAFVAVAQAGGFRDAARLGGVSASSLSGAVRRLEGKLGMRLLNRTTRSIPPTQAGAPLPQACLRGQFASGAMPPWEFERNGEVVRVDPVGPLVVRLAAAAGLAVSAAVAGLGIVHIFEEWLRPHFDCGALEPVLAPWWQSFSGPFLYYPGRRQLPAPLRAFVDFIKN